MGQFSWMYADTNNSKAMKDDVIKDSYLLVPKEFTHKYGTFILEPCYDGYGNFGKYDIYELIAEWNRNCIPNVLRLIDKGIWRCDVSKQGKETLKNYYQDGTLNSDETLRIIGIILACYDEDNRRLDYPIKITTKPMEYENCLPVSETDENQGW